MGPTLGYRGSEKDSSTFLHDWMRKVRSPTPYRVAGSSVHLNIERVVTMAIITVLIVLAVVVVIPAVFFHSGGRGSHSRLDLHPPYNATYPLTQPSVSREGTTFRIAVVADLDVDSKSEDKKSTWTSYFKTGKLTLKHAKKKMSVKWEDEITLESQISEKGRGMELSELVAFNGKLYTCDDRTGIVFEITPSHKMLPWVLLNDGDGRVAKGFKCEWMAVKDEALWAGGLGKEWTTITGIVQNLNPQWVKSIGFIGDVLHHDWVANYNALRKKGGFELPGYMIHESGVWSDFHQQWFFMPRRASTEKYEEVPDETRATNILFRTDENFKHISMSRIGPFEATRGFSSFKFVPGTQDTLIVALKSEEDRGKIASYILAFDLEGKILLPETKIGDHKFEGIEFI